ncbi:D-alanyl-D-alanine carboxypeptidase family protein [Bacillus salacetis]|uniref:D-alanyl-D-alanine carboxypeptidase family protein n=1 Tax=Bacillus salacetis TaxID=2315464 RepID=A0A3A1QN60_9BACI|nr:M15 family metallopeptidase [Bacillus salacetis]RIW28525.1 D-alanyl-D-alanine carboxypeptidase family protein [Bacillus salacetis]
MKKLFLVPAAVLLLSGCQQAEEWTKDLFSSDEPAPQEQENEMEDSGQIDEAQENGESAADEIEENGESADQNEEEVVPPALQLESQFFNEVKTVEGKKVITNPANTLALVNKEFGLSDYKPSDLVRPDVPFVFGSQDLEKAYIRKEAAKALEEMFAAAQKDGLYLTAISGYRSYQYQDMLLKREIKQFGEEKAVKAVAPPGNSEHQSGLAMDISSKSNDFQVSIPFEETPEGKWLKENSYKFGFVLRYPKGKEDITGYQYEPWHFRYVGKEPAKVIFENDWTLEEYFANVKKI